MGPIVWLPETKRYINLTTMTHTDYGGGINGANAEMRIWFLGGNFVGVRSGSDDHKAFQVAAEKWGVATPWPMPRPPEANPNHKADATVQKG